LRHVCVSLFLIVFSASAVGGPLATVSGVLTKSTPANFSGIAVELREIGVPTELLDRAYVSFDGHFEVRGVPSGQYMLSVLASNGQPIHEEYITVQPYVHNINVPLDAKETARPVSGVVSVQQLSHKPSKKARKAFGASLVSKEEGDLIRSQQLLEEAVRLDPEFVEALNNLGARYVAIGRFADASRCFERAIQVAPQTASLYANLAQARIRMKISMERNRLREVCWNSSERTRRVLICSV
jgi:tetratricopeptide (TPR) repeat protein